MLDNEIRRLYDRLGRPRKSTFPNTLITRLHTFKRTGPLVNLQRSDALEYQPATDTKYLTTLQDIMEE